MKTAVELPDDLVREAEARAAHDGQSLRDLVAEGLRVLLHRKAVATRARGSAGAWARQFAGVAALAPGETTDDVRIAYYRRKYAV